MLVAEFGCRPDNALYPNSGPSNANCIVFPTTSTRIVRPGGRYIVENPTAVSLLNCGEEYWRVPISSEGTFATWYTLRDDILDEILFDGEVLKHPTPLPFAAPQISARAETLMRQRQLVQQIKHGAITDSLAIEECIVELTRSVFGPPPALRVTKRAGEAVVQRAVEYLLIHFLEPISLAEIAHDVGASASYLSRAFHAATGMTMSAFRQRLRLIRALDLLPEYAGHLTDLALELGYSSHSHFSKAFGNMFDVSPSDFVQQTVRACPGGIQKRVESWRIETRTSDQKRDSAVMSRAIHVSGCGGCRSSSS